MFLRDFNAKVEGDLMRKFNVTGVCTPEENYMVDITGKLKQIKAMVDEKDYFVINRGRQYGKTTTLFSLEHFLKNEYIVIAISFEGWGDKSFADEGAFCQEFLNSIKEALEISGYSADEQAKWENESVQTFPALGRHIRKICQNQSQKYVLMVDEVDKASNHLVFLNFLGLLRSKYLARKVKKDFTFHSVILVGVYDIRNIKLKMISEGVYVQTTGETVIHNSPWNIAASFKVEMAFSVSEIMTMLAEYEKDHQTGMDLSEVATEIYHYTRGYPVLVSSICNYIDGELKKDWTAVGVRQTVKLVFKESSPLFEGLITNLNNNKAFSKLVYHILMLDVKLPFNLDDPLVNLGVRYGYFSDMGRGVSISNKIFEIRLTNYFTNQNLQEKIQGYPFSQADTDGVIQHGAFNMQNCLEKFSKYYHQYYSQNDVTFFEREARKLFLIFVSAIINGGGFAYMESEQGDGRRTDVIVNFLRQQFIVELKIWRGGQAHEKAQSQLLGYMDKLSLNEGYLLTFDFREKKECHQKWLEFDNGKKIFDVRV